MRKPTRKGLIKKLDTICSEIVRARGRCLKCGASDYPHLDPAHIFSRKYLNTRWDIDLNIICLCDGCHFWAHANPILFTEFVRKKLGEDKYQLLKEAHNLIYKPTLADLQEKLKVLQEIKEG
jgi:hypothetical protein